jgi:hypothetical protein
VIHIATDGSKPGFNFWGSAKQVLNIWFGYRWRKFGIFLRGACSPPEDWFNIAAAFFPTHLKTGDGVKCFGFIFTVRVAFTVTLELQLRFGAQDKDALLKVIKQYAEQSGAEMTFADHSGTQIGKEIAETLNANVAPPKGKLN